MANGVNRARKLLDVMKADAAPPAAAPDEEVDVAPYDGDDIYMMTMEQMMAKLQQTIGPQEQWIVGMRDEDAAFASKVCARIVEELPFDGGNTYTYTYTCTYTYTYTHTYT